MTLLRYVWRRLRYGPECGVCGIPSWMNPPSDHENWLGHRWERAVRQ